MRKLLFLALLFCVPALNAQVPVTLNPYARQQFSDANGNPLAGGCIFTYQAGGSTPLATYTDSTGLFQNTNPLILDSAGEGVMWLTASAYRFVAVSSGGVNCASGTQQWVLDFVTPPPFLSGNNTWTGNQTFSGTSTFNGAVTFAAGGSLNGTFSGTPIISGAWQFTGSPIFSGSPNFSTASPVWGTALQPNLNANSQSISIANAGVTGTAQYGLVKLTGAPSTAVATATTDTGGIVGVCVSGCSTTGNATVQNNGTALCAFDGATVAGDYVQNSTTVANNCHDVGNSYPSSGQAVGRVLSTNVGAGNYNIDLFPAEMRPPSSLAIFPTVVYSTPSGTTTTSIAATTMITVPATATYRYSFSASVTIIGASCSTAVVASPLVTFTDPFAAGSTNTGYGNPAGSAYSGFPITSSAAPNGAVGPAYWLPYQSIPQPITFRAKIGTVIQYTVNLTGGSGCSPFPTYQWFPILEQLTAN